MTKLNKVQQKVAVLSKPDGNRSKFNGRCKSGRPGGRFGGSPCTFLASLEFPRRQTLDLYVPHARPLALTHEQLIFIGQIARRAHSSISRDLWCRERGICLPNKGT